MPEHIGTNATRPMDLLVLCDYDHTPCMHAIATCRYTDIRVQYSYMGAHTHYRLHTLVVLQVCTLRVHLRHKSRVVQWENSSGSITLFHF